jgi:hypothetical protein
MLKYYCADLSILNQIFLQFSFSRSEIVDLKLNSLSKCSKIARVLGEWSKWGSMKGKNEKQNSCS